MQCVSPITLRDEVTGRYNTFPCGSCKYCKENRRNQWSFRLEQEWRNSITAYFYTLTYENVYLPLEEKPPLSGMFEPVLQREHLSAFIKRLRTRKERAYQNRKDTIDKSWQKVWKTETSGRWKGRKRLQFKYPIRFFGVGEYGEQNGRPHYHAIIFNIPNELHIKAAQNQWKYGKVHIGEVNEASIHYTTKYGLKKENFAIMSRNPGIGSNYLDDDSIYKFHSSGNDYVKASKLKVPMPRYYKEKYIQDSKNYKKVLYWDNIEKKDIVRYEPTPYAELRRTKNFIENENKVEAKYIAKGKNPITARSEEDRNRYERFGKTIKTNKLD
jgi:hypothetical protein